MTNTFRGAAVVACGLLIAGCIDASKVAMCPVGPNGPKECAAGMHAADDGLIDDFEDGDTQLSKIADRGGYWFTSHDPNGSTIDPTPFAMSAPGAGSDKSLHVFGHTSGENGAWGVLVGANFVQQGVYDASNYSGISFKAKIAAGSSKNVRFNVADVNTHPDGGVCKTCWNHFGKDLLLTTAWQEYTMSFAELKQQAGWGDHFPAITPSKLMSVNWQIGPGRTYDLWVDDVRFVACK